MPDTAGKWTREMVLTRCYDRVVKRKRFQQAGIPEYWVVDLDARGVFRGVWGAA